MHGEQLHSSESRQGGSRLTSSDSSGRVCVSVDSLIDIYYADHVELGRYTRVTSGEVPEVYRRLLDHTSHMTVTVEAFHGDSVDVTVLRADVTRNHYRREILLSTHTSKKVVQYGIVRLNLDHLADAPRDEILAQSKPLGRVLIEHNVLREIELFDLFRFECGPALAGFFGCPPGSVTYGRTALIYCDNDPAIELLEIVAPAG